MKFSILVPAYKPQFLAECIESILAQTYPNWELIIVNDASPYDIDSIVSKYDDERIHYRKREQGFGAKRLVENWNDCLTDATGEYVINMGDDDKLLPNCLADYVELIGKYPGKNIYHTRVEYIDECSEVTKVQEKRPAVDSVYDMILRKKNGGRICIGEFLFERTSLNNRGGYYNIPYAWGSDDISSYEAAKTTGCANNNQAGFQYRVNPLTISSQKSIIPEKYETTIIWESWYHNFIDDIQIWPPTDLDVRKKVLDSFASELVVLRRTYINGDVEFRLFKGWYYWARKIRKDKSAKLKQRTLLVFLFYALKSRWNCF